MAVPKDKRRYTVTLTPATVDRFQSILKRYKQPPSYMSLTIDHILRGICESFEAVEKVSREAGREPTIGEMLEVLGKSMDSMPLFE